MREAIVLPTHLEAGQEREVQTLLADPWRKLVLIRLRNGALLADHSARVPITIQTLLGKGVLNIEGSEYSLEPGIIVPVDAQVRHHVRAEPELAILVTFFRQPDLKVGNETTARFD